MLEDIDISYDVVQFNGTFVHENIYRQGAGPEVDAAWEALGVGCEWSTILLTRHITCRIHVSMLIRFSHSQAKHSSRFIGCKIGTHKRSCAQKVRVRRRIPSVCRRPAPVALPSASIHTNWIYCHKLKLTVIDRISSANPSSTTMTTITHSPKAPSQTPSEFSAGTSVSPLAFLYLPVTPTSAP